MFQIPYGCRENIARNVARERVAVYRADIGTKAMEPAYLAGIVGVITVGYGGILREYEIRLLAGHRSASVNKYVFARLGHTVGREHNVVEVVITATVDIHLSVCGYRDCGFVGNRQVFPGVVERHCADHECYRFVDKQRGAGYVDRDVGRIIDGGVIIL